MRSRPWPLIILGLVQFFTPLANLMFNAWSLQIPPRYILGWLLERPPLEIFENVALMPIAGLAILSMKRWSYPVFFAAMTWSMASNFRKLAYMSQNLNPVAIGLVYALEIALVIYFLMPSVRKTYLDASVRWWETKPRFDLELSGEVFAHGERFTSKVLNLSEGGVFLLSDKPLAVGELMEFSFRLVSLDFKVNGKVVYSRMTAQNQRAYGVQFIHTPETFQRFHQLGRGLEMIGVASRSESVGGIQSLLHWLHGIVTTGRGWKPEIVNRRPPRD